MFVLFLSSDKKKTFYEKNIDTMITQMYSEADSVHNLH